MAMNDLHVDALGEQQDAAAWRRLWNPHLFGEPLFDYRHQRPSFPPPSRSVIVEQQ
jgi:hypothetical protein